MLRLTLADQTFELLPQRALFWFEQRTLVISDPLFSRSTAFPSADVPYPNTAKASALNRLTTLLNFFEPELLIILGDVLDPADAEDPELQEGLIYWRRQFSETSFFRIHNGVASSRDFLEDFQLKESRESQHLAPFEFHLAKVASKGFVIAGRPHPALKFLDRREGTGVKASCFHLQSASLTLPGFCSAASATAASISPKDGDRVFIIGPNEVVEIPISLAMTADQP
ncbi:hypothetical protein GC173_12345 [bacterium]|nr:hypothetical protein [bacterium]